MKTVLGDQMPYKTLASLRTALRSDPDSFPYKKSHYAMRDNEQFMRWKKILDEKMPVDRLDKFQELKYNDDKKFEELESFKEYVKENPKAIKNDYKKVVFLKQLGVKGEIHIPPKEIKNIEDLAFDNEHINHEREHNISPLEAKKFIKDARVSITKWKGKFIKFYGDNGTTYVDIENGIIRTSFGKNEYDEITKKIVEEKDGE